MCRCLNLDLNRLPLMCKLPYFAKIEDGLLESAYLCDLF